MIIKTPYINSIIIKDHFETNEIIKKLNEFEKKVFKDAVKEATDGETFVNEGDYLELINEYFSLDDLINIIFEIKEGNFDIDWYLGEDEEPVWVIKEYPKDIDRFKWEEMLEEKLGIIIGSYSYTDEDIDDMTYDIIDALLEFNLKEMR